MRQTIFYCLIVLIGLGCCKEQQPTNPLGEVVWKTSFGDGLTNSMEPVVHKDIVVYSAYDSSNLKSKLIAYNKETGVKVWGWQNTKAIKGYLNPNAYYVKDNILILALASKPNQTVAINLDTGKEIWYKPEGGIWQITGIGDKIFQVRVHSDGLRDEVFEADIATGNWRLIYTTTKTQLDAPSYVKGLHSYTSKDGKSYIAFFVGKYKDASFKEAESILFKYSVDSSKMVYEKKLDFIDIKNTSPFLAAATSDKLWLRGFPVYAINEATGEKILEIEPPFPELLSGNLAVFNDKVFMPRTETLICFDGKTGQQLWVDDARSSGSANRFQSHNGVLYFTGSGTSFLHAFDIETGKRVWRLSSPDKEKAGSGFDAVVTVDPLSNKLYTATYLSAICYKTAR
jgi:outer membrane protein assembly factor BamB